MENKIRFVPVPTQKASEAIFDQIRGMIMGGILKPGDRLPSERNMMDMLQRSRPTIREALRMLENAGLVRIIPGGGATVMEPSASTVEQPLESMLTLSSISGTELLEFRLLNEVAIAGWAAERRDQSDMDALQQCLKDARAAVRREDTFFELDIRFHALIAVAARNRLAGIIDKVIHQMVSNILITAYRKKDKEHRLMMCRAILSTHEKLLAAIRAGDADAARELMRGHLSLFEEDVLHHTTN